ncbi:MAG: sulfatase [Mariniphaga sp.]|nr:sulfatase [Mariniphaga sp.]
MKFPKLFLILLLVGMLFSCEKEDIQPNIIFIMSDDHAYQAVSAYDDRFAEVAPTPNIDRIYENGMRFDRCFVTNSICGPSRATILTGKYSHLNGFTENEKSKFDGNQQTFPKLLQVAGYQTAMIGKWHLDSEPTGFDYWDVLPGQGNYYNADFKNEEGQYRVEGYVTDIITEKTLGWLKNSKQKEKPFMLMMHHKAPHRAWQPSPKYLDRFENVEFPEPETLFDDYSGRGSAEKEQDMTISKTMRLTVDLKMWPDTTGFGYKGFARRLTENQLKKWNDHYMPIIEKFKEANPEGDDLVRFKYQRYMNDYLACIQSVDESVGAVLDYLKETGLDKNTIVIYTSDQGFYLGEHGWFDKRFMFEESLRTPLLVSWPGKIEAGSINNDMVSNLDFAETFLDAAGVEIPEDMQGESLVPVFKGNTPEDWRNEHYYHYYEYPGWHYVKRHYGITTDRYKLIHFYYNIDEWELFDLEKDPQEMKNFYDDPAYAEARAELHVRLEKLMEKYGDSDELAKSYIPKTPPTRSYR